MYNINCYSTNHTSRFDNIKTEYAEDEENKIRNAENLENYDLTQVQQFETKNNTDYFSLMFCTSNNDNKENSHPHVSKGTDTI